MTMEDRLKTLQTKIDALRKIETGIGLTADEVVELDAATTEYRMVAKGDSAEVVPAATQATVPVAETVVAAPAAVAPTESEDWDEVEVNIEAFDRGGVDTIPPAAGAGTYPGVCTGHMVPSGAADDQLWFKFESREQVDGRPAWMGFLVTAALNVQDGKKSGAWKMKDILDALGASHQHTETGIRFRGHKNKPCQVQWEMIELRSGGTELRIQNVFAPGVAIGDAI